MKYLYAAAISAALVSLCIHQSVARSLGADESCASDAERVDFANVIFCIPKGNELYRYEVGGYSGLQFLPQAFVGEQRVSPNSFYDTAGNAPPEGTFVYVGVKQPRYGGLLDAKKQARLVRALRDAIRVRLNEQTFSQTIDSREFEFEHRNSATIVGTSAPEPLDQQIREIWVRLDAANQTRHTMICDYTQSANPMMACVSRFIVVNSAATIRLFGGTPERSFRISEKIREDIEAFIVSDR